MTHRQRTGPQFSLTTTAWTLILLLACFYTPLGAAPAPVQFDETVVAKPFGEKVAYLKDASRDLTITNIIRDRLPWQQSDQPALNFGFTPAAYWFRFTVNNRLATAQKFFLELTYPHLDNIELYIPQPRGVFKKIQSGDQLRFSKREVPDKNFVFPLNQPPGARTYYFRVVTASSLNFKPLLYSTTGYRHKLNRVYPVFWLYYGALLIMIVYNLILFFLIRERAFLLLVLFISAYFLLQFSLNGFSVQYLWPNAIWWANNCLPLLMCLSAGLFFVFARHFLKTAEQYPGTIADKLEKYGVIAPNFIWALFCLSGKYALNIRVATLLLGLTTLLFLISAIIRRERSRSMGILGASGGFMGLGLLLFIGKTIGLLPANFITTWSVQIGSAIFIAFLSLGLADRITVLKNELLATNANVSEILRSISKNGETVETTPAIQSTTRPDNIGTILQTRFETFMQGFKQLIDDVRGNADILNSSATGLLNLSDRMTRETGEISTKSDAVAESSRDMNDQMTSISQTMSHTSENVDRIAASTEEMTATVQEIIRHTETARQTTAEAVSHSGTVSHRVDELGQAAEKIGTVTETITDISKKTNLLALNATIEAARAGESGRGFAVVAGEIKDLARQTAAATQQINQQIEENRTITSEAVAQIKQITEIIKQVDEIVSTIAGSIEAQSGTTREIAGNVTQISQGVTNTSERLAQCATVVNTVSEDVNTLSQSSHQMNTHSEQVKASAAELSQMASYLTDLMKKFLV